MAYKLCKDIKLNENVNAVYFDGSAQAIYDLQKLLKGSNQLNTNTLHTRIGQWVCKYKDGSIIWRKGECFNSGYTILN